MKNLFIVLLLIVCKGYSQAPCAGALPLQNSFRVQRTLTDTPVIFLDFDGSWISGIYWSGTDYQAAPSGLSKIQIDSVLIAVKEDFSPFVVKVTTDSNTYLNSPIKGQHVVITTTDKVSTGSGGVSYTGSFEGDPNANNFVYSNNLSFSQKFVADAISHEVGHSLDLNHQALWNGCTLVSQYNPGNSFTGPLMGNAYNSKYTRWAIGLTPFSCEKLQSDIDTIAKTLMIRPPANTALGSSINIKGVVTPTPDFYSLVITSSLLSLNVSTIPRYSNLVPVLGLLDKNKNLITHNTDTTLSAGQYYISVAGDTYGSLGQYSLTGSATTVLSIHDNENRQHPDRINKNTYMANNVFHFYSKTIDMWRIYDAVGRKVLYGECVIGQNTINLTKLAHGLYIFKTTDHTEKILK